MDDTIQLRKEDRYVSIADAIAIVETFAEKQQRSIRIQNTNDTTQENTSIQTISTTLSDTNVDQVRQHIISSTNLHTNTPNIVVLECINAPDCKWYVRLSFMKTEQKWKISSMNTTHHKIHCIERKDSIALSTDSNIPTTNIEVVESYQQMLRTSSNTMDTVVSNTAVNTTMNPTNKTMQISFEQPTIQIGQVFPSWKEAIGTIRQVAHQLGRRAVAEKGAPVMINQQEYIQRTVNCQNLRNSLCGWMVELHESPSEPDQYTIYTMNLVHSPACQETSNFHAYTKTPTSALSMTQSIQNAITTSTNTILADDDLSKYVLHQDMRWSTGKDATKAISDFALVMQRKRAKLCKKNNGGSNKKYVCSDESCLWFVQLVKGWKSKNWKISAMNLKHSPTCTGTAKPTARQLAEMHFFRQAVITHSKSNGKLLTESFLHQSEAGIKIPRGMAYRAQRLVVATSTDDLTESYKFIPSLLNSFAVKNQGSTIAFEKDDQMHFVRAFLMPNAASLSLINMQQVFGIQVFNYTTVNYCGSLVLLISRDGNLDYQVLAFALLPEADMENLKWFLSLAKSGGCRFEGSIVFVQHNQNGVVRALSLEARNTKVMYCVQSLIQEIKADKSISNLTTSLEAFIWKMQKQETEEEFNKILRQLEAVNGPAATYLRAVHPKNWTCYLNRNLRLYGWNSTGYQEALAGSDILTSDEAPFDLIYSFLGFLMDNIFKKSQLAMNLRSDSTPLTTRLTPGVDAVYRLEIQESQAYTVRKCDAQVAFTWRTGERPKVTHRVDLAMNTCTCLNMFQLGIPCRHFIAVAIHCAKEGILVNAFDNIYKADMYADVYENLRLEIPSAEDLHKDETILPAVTQKHTRYKKRARSNSVNPSTQEQATTDSIESIEPEGEAQLYDVNKSRHIDVNTDEPSSKSQRLDFDTDVVADLSELV